MQSTAVTRWDGTFWTMVVLRERSGFTFPLLAKLEGAQTDGRRTEGSLIVVR